MTEPVFGVASSGIRGSSTLLSAIAAAGACLGPIVAVEEQPAIRESTSGIPTTRQDLLLIMIHSFAANGAPQERRVSGVSLQGLVIS